MKTYLIFVNLILLTLVLLACAPQHPSNPEPELLNNQEQGRSKVSSPSWFDHELTDVSTGENFKMSDFQGKVVVVEFMAMWCSNCLRQQEEVKMMYETLALPNDLVIIAIDVDVNENSEDLKQYAQDNGFGWKYAVASLTLAREISAAYGQQFINPPSAPMLVVDRQGNVILLPFGFKPSADLKNIVQPLLDSDA